MHTIKVPIGYKITTVLERKKGKCCKTCDAYRDCFDGYKICNPGWYKQIDLVKKTGIKRIQHRNRGVDKRGVCSCYLLRGCR